MQHSYSLVWRMPGKHFLQSIYRTAARTDACCARLPVVHFEHWLDLQQRAKGDDGAVHPAAAAHEFDGVEGGENMRARDLLLQELKDLRQRAALLCGLR